MDSHRDQSKGSISVVVLHSHTVKFTLVTSLFYKKNMQDGKGSCTNTH